MNNEHKKLTNDEEWNKIEKEILSILPEGPISAEDMALRIGVTRQAVYKHLRKHRNEGNVIQARGKWVWQLEREITRKELSEQPEIRSLQKACKDGDLIYDIRRLDFFAPKVQRKYGEIPSSRFYTRQERERGRQVGAVYVNVDSLITKTPSHEEMIWKITAAGRDYFLEKSPYFLAESLSHAISSDSFNDLNLDIDYFTGVKDPRKLTDSQITRLTEIMWDAIKTFQVIYSINSMELRKWLMTESGKEALTRAVSNPIVLNLAQRKKELLALGDVMTERFGRHGK
jgi:biotin operon repressor